MGSSSVGSSSVGSSTSLYTHRGSFFLGDCFTELIVVEKETVVAAGVESGDVVASTLVSEVVLCRLVFSRLSRDLLDTGFATVRAVLPHGN